MHVTIITAFPGFFKDFLTTSIVGRAIERKLITVDLVDLREFGRGRYHQIDDAAFGSGGQILTAPVMKDALDAAVSGVSGLAQAKRLVVYPSPQGVMLTQDIIESLAMQEHVIILCGHYEGIDERFVERFVDLEVTVGDCVLTGGEIPAMTIVDAMSRLVPEVVGREGAVQDDSFYRGMLDHPHYTRPASWDANEIKSDVPEVLLSGNDSEINLWRRGQAITRTLERRPDLIERAAIDNYLAAGARLAVVFDYDTPGPGRETFDAMSALCRAYNLGRPFFVIANPDCRKALSAELASSGDAFAPKIFGSVGRVLGQLAGRGKGTSEAQGQVLIIEILARACAGAIHWRLAKKFCLESSRDFKSPVLFLIHAREQVHAQEQEREREHELNTRVIRTFISADARDDGNNTLPLTIRAAIALDRLMGQR